MLDLLFGRGQAISSDLVADLQLAPVPNREFGRVFSQVAGLVASWF